MMLVTPNWPAQPWYSQLLALCIEDPPLLPDYEELLVDLKGQVHSLLLNRTLKLNARKFSGKTLLKKGFQIRLQNFIKLRRQGTTTISWSGKNGLAGLVKSKLIRLHCSINFALDFLANLFENRYEYSAIKSHRLVISA